MSAIIGPNLFVMGGWDGYECLDSIEKANLLDKAPSFSLLPRRRGLMDMIKNGQCIYDDENHTILVIGGWTERQTTDNVLVYNPNTMQCDFSGITLPKPIEGHSVVKLNNQVFILGGFDSYGVTDSIMRLDLQTRRVSLLETKLD